MGHLAHHGPIRKGQMVHYPQLGVVCVTHMCVRVVVMVVMGGRLVVRFIWCRWVHEVVLVAAHYSHPRPPAAAVGGPEDAGLPRK